MVPRPSARVVLIDDTDRLLLFSSRNEHDGTVRWYTPGGGLQPGESHLDAALRELYEETGLTGVLLGPEVSMATLARYCRVHSYLITAKGRGIRAIDAIHAAISGRPWLHTPVMD